MRLHWPASARLPVGVTPTLCRLDVSDWELAPSPDVITCGVCGTLQCRQGRPLAAGGVIPPEPGVSSASGTPADRQPYGCGGCDARWSGLSRAHCSRCHRTFAGVSLFDAHQRLRGEHGYCLDPAAMTDHGQALVQVAGVWRSSVSRPRGSWGRDD